MRVLVAAALIVAASSSAMAQTTTTNCRPTYAGAPQLGMTCDTTAPPAARHMAPTASAGQAATPQTYSWKDVKPAQCSSIERLSLGTSYCEARQVAATRKAIGEQIASGDCGGALKAALGTGDLDYAREVRDFCATNK